MQWSQLKKRTEAAFDPALHGRVEVFSTRYGGCSCGRGWISVDGEQLVNFGTFEWSHPDSSNYLRGPVLLCERHADRLSEPGELTRFDLHEACWRLVHESPHELLKAEEPLTRALATLHARVGLNRLAAMRRVSLHPLVTRMIELRLEANVAAEVGIRSAQR